MHKTNSLLMHAPKMTIFETAANLELWPKILPHYRYIRFLERGSDRNVVVMAAERSGIPISWTSEQIIERSRLEDARSSQGSVLSRASAPASIIFGTESSRKEVALPRSQASIRLFSACAAPARFAIGIQKSFFHRTV